MRIRSLKPDFWSHPIMGRLDSDSCLLAIALLNYADDEGYFMADPILVRAACRPFVEDSTKVRRWLDDLSRKGWIERCESVDHGPIGRVVNFTEHQKIDRPKESRIKPYWIDDASTIDRRLIDDASLLEQGAGNREQGTGSDVAKTPRKATAFLPPTLEQVQEHIRANGYTFSAAAFVSYYKSNGWRVGRTKMRDWQAACVTWQAREKQNRPSNAIHDRDISEYASHIIICPPVEP